MASLEAYLMTRVDAARQLMQRPQTAAEGSGRLFLAKRCHEAAKARTLDATTLPPIVAELMDSMSAAASDGVRDEGAAVAAWLAGHSAQQA